MTDWASRNSPTEQPVLEMKSQPSYVEPDETIAAIRRIIEEQEHLLPRDILEAEALRRESDTQAALASATGPRGRILAAILSLRG